MSYNAPAALEHLQKAIEWQPDNAQAYRLPGMIYRVQGDKILDSKSQALVAAAGVLTRYTELRPNNPLGHIELAEVYEAVEAEMRAMHLADLVASLPQAAVQALVPVDVFVLDSVRMQDGRGMISDVARERVGGMTGRARWSW